MARFLCIAVNVLMLSAAFGQYVYAGAEEHLWKNDEMTQSGATMLKNEFSDNREASSTVRLQHIKVRLNSKIQTAPLSDCAEDECFDLYYFTGENFDLNNRSRKNILFIPGGPGQIVRKNSRFARFLEAKHNLIYFHLRGAGLSIIPNSNTYDKFLRAEYVVGDIERLRTKILGPDGAWDAIYGYSYGTVIAQRYANEHHERVRRLILSAPVVRNDNNFEKARRKQALSTLVQIYTLLRSKDSNSCDCQHKPDNVPFEFHMSETIQGVDASDNFCFLDPAAAPENNKIQKIKHKLEEVYEELEDRYGALGFVVENYQTLKSDTEFTTRFPYPEEFFLALKQLQLLGAPAKESGNSLLFSEDIREMVNSAIILGYYALFEKTALLELQNNHFRECKLDASFFEAATHSTCQIKKTYCERAKLARDDLMQRRDGAESLRALYVFGVSDGMDQWLPRILKSDSSEYQNGNCPTSLDIRRFLDGSSQKYKFLREEGKKIGDLGSDPFCLWTPANLRHGVPTLILKGAADAVTARCQAETFFNDGLTKGERVLIEFAGMGHKPNIRFLDAFRQPTKWGDAYAKLIEIFLENSVADYRQSGEVKAQLDLLKAKDRTPSSRVDLVCANQPIE